MQPAGAPPPKKKSNVLLIVLGVIGFFGLLVLGTCAAGALWVKRTAETALDGGAFVLEAPPDVKTALAGPKKNFVGEWKSEKGSTLTVDPNGMFRIEIHEAGSNETLQAPIASFVGDDITIKAFVTITVPVTQPPREVNGKWQMVAKGVTFER